MDTKPWSNLKARIYSWISRKPKSNVLVVDLARLEPTERVLDIGCGPGAAVRAAAARLDGGRATGIDRSQGMVEIARKRTEEGNATFEVGTAERIPFSDNSFDVVWTVSSFHHWEDTGKGLAESVRVLRPGGRLLVLEHKTKGKHGLDQARAEALADRLRVAGFGESSVSEHAKYLLVKGVVVG